MKNQEARIPEEEQRNQDAKMPKKNQETKIPRRQRRTKKPKYQDAKEASNFKKQMPPENWGL